MGELLQRNIKLTEINMAGNHISCSEFEPYGFYLMRLLSSNNTVTVRHPVCVCVADWLQVSFMSHDTFAEYWGYSSCCLERANILGL